MRIRCLLLGHRWSYGCSWGFERPTLGPPQLAIWVQRVCRCGRSESLVWEGTPMWLDTNAPFSRQRLAYFHPHVNEIEADYRAMTTELHP